MGDLWRFFRTQNLAYWAMCFYLVVEYVRPQQLIGAIRGAPLGLLGLGTALFAYLATGAQAFGMKGVASWLMLLFTAVIIASSFGAFDPGTSFEWLRVWISWVVIYFLIVNVVNTRQRFAFFILLWLICNYYMAQGGARQFAMRGFRFAPWGIRGAPGWFENSGEFGIAMCMFVAISWHFYIAAKSQLTNGRKLFMLGMPATGVLCVIGSSSRGALLGLGAVVGWELLRSKARFKSFVGVALLAGAVWFILPAEQKARFSQVGADRTSESRKLYWKNGLEMTRMHPVLGVGYNNWVKYYTVYYYEGSGVTKYFGVQVAHNIFIQCMAELGYTGLFVFLLLIAATLHTNYRTRRAARAGPAPPDEFLVHMALGLDGAMLSYIVAGLFVTVLYYPFFWINLALTVALSAIANARPRQDRVGGVVMSGPPYRGPARARPMVLPH